jgi:hypothetical protein
MKMFRCNLCDRRRPRARMFGFGPFFCTNRMSCHNAARRLERALARRVLSRPEWPQHHKAWDTWKRAKVAP